MAATDPGQLLAPFRRSRAGGADRPVDAASAGSAAARVRSGE